MKDGIYFGLSEDLYFSDSRIGSTELRILIDSPCRFWWESYLNPLRKKKKKKVLNDGKIFHKLLLEGDKAFERDYVIAPNLHPASKEYKAWKEHQVKEIVKESDVVDARLIVNHLRKTTLQTLLSDGFPEVSILWTDKNGLKRRTRIDYLRVGQLIDLKSFTDFKNTQEFFSRYFWDYKVFIQLQDYIEALKSSRDLPVVKGTAKQRKFWEDCTKVNNWLPWVCFVSREFPQYRIKAYTPEKCPDLYKVGRDMIEKAYENYAKYMERFGTNNAWIDEPETDDLQFTDVEFPQIMGVLL